MNIRLLAIKLTENTNIFQIMYREYFNIISQSKERNIRSIFCISGVVVVYSRLPVLPTDNFLLRKN